MPLSAAAIAALHAACFPRPWAEEEFARLLSQPGVFVRGDERGFILCRIAADECEVLTFAVAPEHQRKGIGKALLAEVMQCDAKKMFLEVGEGNAAALALYRAAGFTEISRRKAYYHNGEAALILAREL